MRKILSFMIAALFSVSLFADTYTVAGSSAAIFGETWNPANTANDMVAVEGEGFENVYQLVKEGISLEASFEYKVVKNHDWNSGANAYPAENATCEIAAPGVYTLTFSFNSETHDVGCRATKTADLTEHTYTAVGGAATLFGTTWDPTNTANDMTQSTENENIYVFTKNGVNLTAGKLEYKVCQDHAWDVSYPATANTNFEYTVEEDGNYDVTISFNVTDETAEVVAEKKGEAAFEEITLYCVNSLGWATMNAYAWIDGEHRNADWPGVAMTATEATVNNKAVYAITLTTAYAGVIFNEHGDGEHFGQTKDLMINAATPYFVPSSEVDEDNHFKGTWYASLEDIPVEGGEGGEGGEEQPVEDITLYYVDVLNWGAANAYAWNDKGQKNAEWPGEAMISVDTQIQGINVYSIAIPSNYVGIIFNYGSDKTADLMNFNAAAPYFVPNTEKNEAGKYEGQWYAFEAIPELEPIAPVVHTYTVAGEQGLMGVDWNPAEVANDMILDEETGLYKLVKTGLTLNVKSYGYKVVVDHDWNNASYPAENALLAIEERAIYTVTFTFNVATMEVGAAAQKTGEAEPLPELEMVDLTVHAGPWAEFALGVWAWADYSKGLEANFYPVDAESHKASIPQLADSIVVAAFRAGVEMTWANSLGQTANLLINSSYDLYLNEGYNFVTWTQADPTPMVQVSLAPGVWNVDGAKFAAVTWREGETMFENGHLSWWFAGEGDAKTVAIPADADSIAFARFSGELAMPTLNMTKIWNHTDMLLIDKESYQYTITGWAPEGSDCSTGYWGEDKTALDVINASEKAEKILRNGQIFIIRENKIYSIIGARVQ